MNTIRLSRSGRVDDIKGHPQGEIRGADEARQTRNALRTCPVSSWSFTRPGRCGDRGGLSEIGLSLLRTARKLTRRRNPVENARDFSRDPISEMSRLNLPSH